MTDFYYNDKRSCKTIYYADGKKDGANHNTDGNKKPTEKNDREQMKDIIECKNDRKNNTEEEDDFYEKMYLEYVKKEESALGFRENFEDNDVDDDVETETKPEKPKKETPQEKHNDDAYETEDEDGNTIYVSETIDYDVFKKSITDVEIETPRKSNHRLIDEASVGATRFRNEMVEPKFQKKYQDMVSKVVGIEFKDGKIADFESFQEQMEDDSVPSDEVEKYDNWEAAVHHTFAKHPESFEDVDGLEEAIELQKELNEVRKKNFDEADYLWRGMNITELENAGEGIEDGQGKDQSWSIDYNESARFFKSGSDAGNTMILLRVPKNTDGMYDINYSVFKEGDDFSKFTTQGLNYIQEDEYRLKNRDMSQIFDGVATVMDNGMSEDERKAIRERIPRYKVVFKKG